MQRKYIAIVLFSSLLSAFFAISAYHFLVKPRVVYVQDDTQGKAQYAAWRERGFSDNSSREFRSAAPTNFIKAAETVTPVVVNIKALQNSTLWNNEGGISTSNGSGVLVSSDGYIVTNNHVVEGSTDLEVTLNSGADYDAKIIGTDPSTDLALIKIEVKRTPFLAFGNSDSLRVGEWVLAVGNPFNLQSTVTAGIVSAKSRNIDILEGRSTIESFIQTDAAVNPGNSGGALVNTNGELVGINTAIITKSGRYEGYSFAVPSNLVQKVIRDLKEFGVVQRGLLGVAIEDMSYKRAQLLGLPTTKGIYLSNVMARGAAAEAGLRTGDVIMGVNGVKVNTRSQLQEQLARLRPGNEVVIEYFREGKTDKATATLKNENNTTETVNASDASILRSLGFELRNLTQQEARRLGISGVKVTRVEKDSRVARTRMEDGFIITKINDRRATDVDTVIKSLQSLRESVVILEGFYENYEGEFIYKFPMN